MTASEKVIKQEDEVFGTGTLNIADGASVLTSCTEGMVNGITIQFFGPYILYPEYGDNCLTSGQMMANKVYKANDKCYMTTDQSVSGTVLNNPDQTVYEFANCPAKCASGESFQAFGSTPSIVTEFREVSELPISIDLSSKFTVNTNMQLTGLYSPTIQTTSDLSSIITTSFASNQPIINVNSSPSSDVINKIIEVNLLGCVDDDA